jgi:hypothetical protein
MVSVQRKARCTRVDICYRLVMAKDPAPPPGPDRVALATFALLAAQHQERVGIGDPRTVEQILKSVAFTPNEIHGLTGENLNTVKSRMYAAPAKPKKSKAKTKAKK